MTIVVRRMRADEWERYRAVRLAALLDAPSAFGSSYGAEADRPDAEWMARADSGARGDERATFFAIDDESGDEVVVGLVGGYVEVDGSVDLVSMWTSPAARRQSVGRLLVRAVVEWAGDRPLSLWVTRGNDAAHGLYTAMGFVESGEHQPLPSDPCKDETRMVLRRG